MADRRRRTLLDFAIAASAAVVPVLLLVLFIVGVVRPADPATAGRIGDRHVSVRQVAALKTFERAIVRRPSVTVGPPTAILILDRLPQCRCGVGRPRRHPRSTARRAREHGGHGAVARAASVR